MSFDHSAQAKKRILWQYRNGTAFAAWIDTLPSIAQTSIETPLETIINVLDIDNAGTWALDVCGEIAGVRRDNDLLLDNDTYRTVIKSKIAKNSCDGLIDSIAEVTAYITGSTVLTINDNQDMTFSIIFDGELDATVKSILSQIAIIPRPQGVKLIGYLEYVDIVEFGDTDAEFGDLDAEFVGFTEVAT